MTAYPRTKTVLKHGLFVLLMLCMLVPASLAQSGDGQLCVRAFEDRNGNGSFEPDEPLLTRSVAASLADIENVIIQSLLLDDLPQAATGIMCFQNLAPGNYTISVSSADYNATTDTTFLSTVTETSVPQVFEYGGQSILAVNPDTGSGGILSEADRTLLVQRLFFSALGATLVMAGMFVIGVILAFLFFRPRPQPVYPPQQYATGTMQRVTQTTGQIRPVQAVPMETRPVPAEPADPNKNYMPPRQDRLDTGAMARFTLEESGSQPIVALDEQQLEAALLHDFVLDDEDTGQSAAIKVVPDEAFKPPATLEDAVMSDFVLDDEDTGQSAAIRAMPDDAPNDEDTGKSAAIRDEDIADS